MLRTHTYTHTLAVSNNSPRISDTATHLKSTPTPRNRSSSPRGNSNLNSSSSRQLNTRNAPAPTVALPKTPQAVAHTRPFSAPQVRINSADVDDHFSLHSSNSDVTGSSHVLTSLRTQQRVDLAVDLGNMTPTHSETSSKDSLENHTFTRLHQHDDDSKAAGFKSDGPAPTDNHVSSFIYNTPHKKRAVTAGNRRGHAPEPSPQLQPWVTSPYHPNYGYGADENGTPQLFIRTITPVQRAVVLTTNTGQSYLKYMRDHLTTSQRCKCTHVFETQMHVFTRLPLIHCAPCDRF
jgi:hypothetical protein